MKKLLFLFALVMMAISASAVPAKPGVTKTLTLSDGTTVKATLVGDEFGHYWLAGDGTAYTSIDDSGIFVPIAKDQVIANGKQMRSKANAKRALRMPRRAGAKAQSNFKGQKKGLIILVNFTDVKFKTSNNNAFFTRMANEVGYSDGDFKGSVRDYFYDQSLGQFELTFDVVGPYTLSKKMSTYGGNDKKGYDKAPGTMVTEALNLANGDVNYADYDWDGDGEVEQVFIIYAGQGEADGGSANTIWPHEWSLSNAYASGYGGSGAVTLDGVKIDTYACGPELNGDNNIDGIGTICHEFSHCLGYPDYYDTDYSGGQGMGYWDLMDGGSYNGDGFQPAGYTSYERWVAGWEEPAELLATQAVTGMKPLQEGGGSYVIYNQGNKNEFYLLENRQFTGWDASLPGKGLLILHVDYDATAWDNNEPNDDPSHQRMTWIAADNNYQYTTSDGTKYYDFDGMANDTYPYGSVNSFGAGTTPAAKLYNKNTDGTYYLDSSVENIVQNADGTVSFNFKGVSNVATPAFSPVAGVYTEAQQVTISCATDGAVIYYTTDGTTPTSNSSKYTDAISVESTTTIKAVAILDGEESAVATGKYIIRDGSAGDGTTFRLATSTSDLADGMRCIIACGSKQKAAGGINNTYLSAADVTVDDDVITIGDDVKVFTLEGSGKSWSLIDDDGNYLVATAAKKVSLGSTQGTWTMANDNSGVIMSYSSYGTILYNVNSPRFTTYTSNTSTSMIYANVYVEDVATTKKSVTMTFSATSANAIVGEDFTAPALTTDPAGLEVTYTSSDTNVAAVADDGTVTILAAGTTTITAIFAGNDQYESAQATYTLTVSKKADDEPATGDGRYQLVTNADDLESGKNYLIVSAYEGSYYAYNGFSTNKGATGSVTPEDDIIDLNLAANNAVPVVLSDAGDGTWSILDTESQVYLGANTSTTGSNSKYLFAGNDASSDYYKWTVSVSDDGVSEVKNAGKDFYLKYNNGADMFRIYTSGQQDISLYKEITDEPEPVKINISQVGWGTFCWDQPLNFEGTDMAAYKVSGLKFDDNELLKSVVVTRVDQVPAYTGILIKAAQGEYDVPEDRTINPSEFGQNGAFDLIGIVTPVSLDPVVGDNTNLVLTARNGKACFAPLGSTITYPANKAYLNVLTEFVTASANGISIVEEGADAITYASGSDADSDAWYTITGVRVQQPTVPGLYIHNGRKTIVR